MNTISSIKIHKTLFILLLIFSSAHAQTKKIMQNNYVLLNEKGYPIPTDSILKNFSFFYVQNRTVAGMVSVPPPVKAQVSTLYYYTKTKERKPFQNAVTIRLETDSPASFNGILIKHNSAIGTLLINDYQYNDSAGFTLFRVAFKNKKQQIVGLNTEIPTFELSFFPEYYLTKDTLYERATLALELTPQQVSDQIRAKRFICDTLCGAIKSPLFTTTVIWLHNKINTNDSVFLLVEGLFSKKVNLKNITHGVHYLPPDALDMEQQINITIHDKGTRKKKKYILIGLPPLCYSGNYTITIERKKGVEEQKEYLVTHQYHFCPMMITISPVLKVIKQ